MVSVVELAREAVAALGILTGVAVSRWLARAGATEGVVLELVPARRGTPGEGPRRP